MDIHLELERRLAAFKKTEAVVVFQSGFAANAGTVAAVSARASTVVWAAMFGCYLIVPCFGRAVARSHGSALKIGSKPDGAIDVFGHVADVWVTPRRAWKG